MNVDAPAVAPKVTVVCERKTVSEPVRSTETTYDSVVTIAARSTASLRVRFSPGTGFPSVVFASPVYSGVKDENPPERAFEMSSKV